MTDPVPQPRYYDTGSSRRAFLVGAGAALLVGGAVAATALGTDVFSARRNGGGSSGALAPGGGDGAGGGDDGRDGGGDHDGNGGDGSGVGSSGRRLTSMAMVGDSITAGSKPALVYTLTAKGFDGITIDGLTSRRIEIGDGSGAPLSGIRTMYEMIAFGVKPDAWVIALGTNDVGQYNTNEDYTRLIDAMASMLPTKMPLVWVDVYRPEYIDASLLFNQLLREYMDRRGSAVVANWYDLAAAPDQNILKKDHIHPNDRGNGAFASLVNDAIAALPGN